MKSNILWLIGLLGLLSLALIHGCDQDRSAQSPVAPEGTVAQKVVLRIGGVPSKANAKVVGLRIDAAGIDEKGAQIGQVIPPVSIANPTFPQAVELTLYRPPCRYRITVTTDLSRDPARTWEDQIDICQQKVGTLAIDVFESFLVDQLTIHAPDAVNAGEAVAASCEGVGLNAPDSAQYPLTVTLSERGGSHFDASPNGLTISGSFPDPYTAEETQRVLNCAIADGRSAPQTVTKTIARILPTPIPGVTVTPVPEVTVTPTPTPIGSSTLTITKSGTGTGTVTSAPAGINCGGTCRASFKNGTRVTLTATPDTGMGFVNWSGACTGAANSCTVTMSEAQTVNVEFVNLCLVTKTNDSVIGSLRQVIADAVTNGCSSITFASGVTTITVTNPLTIDGGTLVIDGGTGVTISGGHTSNGVFSINSGTVVVFKGLTITQGNSASFGGGISNGGKITIESDSIVSYNSADNHGGGIYNYMGTVIVKGTVSNNTSLGYGGGIYNYRGNVTVNGNISNNQATNSGGGIANIGSVAVTGATAANVLNNTTSTTCNNYYWDTSGCVLP
ncbi:fubronectin, type III domain protein [Candidatus Moduliflexus flocculans]|uniref:Fubronectin, type III domain protein n=1 Tax=Candidatus Moduliflexus flocculans TaxID=1499966 RepID=A0A0S6VU08_9BACT|nr:fubronectin, type III domain protein [Candidatus Moduliflexus flocculans]